MVEDGNAHLFSALLALPSLGQCPWGQEVWSTNHIGGDPPSPLGVTLVLEKSWSPSLEGLKAGEGGGGVSDSQRMEKRGLGLGGDGVAEKQPHRS